MSRKILENELIEDLKRVGEIINKIPTIQEYIKFGKFSIFPYKKQKPWIKWIEEVFGKYKMKNITEQELAEDLKKVKEILNKIPTEEEYSKLGKYSFSTFFKIKCWSRWCKDLFPGFKKSNSLKISEEELIKDLKNVFNIIGKIPSESDYKNYGKYSKGTYISRMSWNEWCLRCFGEINRENSSFTKVSNEDLINNLIDVKEKLGKVPKKEDLSIENGSKYSINSYRRAFGNLANALMAAEMQPHQVRGLNDEEILKDVLEIYSKLGRTPTRKEYLEFSKYKLSCATFINRFGSWNDFLKICNIPIIFNHNVTKEEVIKAIKERYEKYNDLTCLSYWSIRKAGDNDEFPYSCNTIKKKFNDLPWEEIMKECGFDYTTVNQFFSRNSFFGDDGNEYLSLLEKTAGNCLYKFKHENKIKNYIYEELVCDERHWTCDFKIILNNDKEVWLEIDGLRNNRKDPYKSGKNDKINYYKANNYDFEIISYNNKSIENSITYIIDKRN